MTKSQSRTIADFINKKFSIEEVIKSYGFNLKNDGDGRFGMRCPFHNEKTASFKVYLNTNRFHCYGCSESGSVVEFIMLQEKKSREEVLDRFKDNVDVTSNKFIVDSIIKNMNKPTVDPVKYSKNSHFELRVYLRDLLKKNPNKKQVIDECFKDMRQFFFNPDNTDESMVIGFSDGIMDRVK